MTYSPSFILTRVINLILAIVEFFIVLRIILKLFGASASAPFVAWVYETSRGLVAPFLGMFPAPVLEGGFVIEFSSIIALIVYAMVAYLLIELISYIDYTSTTTYRRQVVTTTE